MTNDEARNLGVTRPRNTIDYDDEYEKPDAFNPRVCRGRSCRQTGHHTIQHHQQGDLFPLIGGSNKQGAQLFAGWLCNPVMILEIAAQSLGRVA